MNITRGVARPSAIYPESNTNPAALPAPAPVTIGFIFFK
jgi:hypothetical protein